MRFSNIFFLFYQKRKTFIKLIIYPSFRHGSEWIFVAKDVFVTSRFVTSTFDICFREILKPFYSNVVGHPLKLACFMLNSLN